MITLNVTFLLGINLVEIKPGKKAEKKRKSKKTKKSSTSSRNSNKTNKSSKQSKSKEKAASKSNIFELSPDDENVSIFYPGECVANFQIDYELLPNYKHSVNVDCWGGVVKITTTDGSKWFTTRTQNDVIWIPVSLTHYLKPLSDEQLHLLLNHSIDFAICAGSKRPSAKSNKEALLYILTENLQSERFEEMLADKPADPVMPQTMEEYIYYLLEFCINFAISTSVSCINNLRGNHLTKVNGIMRKIKDNRVIYCNSLNFCGISLQPNENNKDNNRNKSAKVNSKAFMRVSVPAKVLLTDPLTSLFQFERNHVCHQLYDGYVLLSSQNLMSMRQKFEFAPMVIKLKKISNLPHQVLLENGFKNIFLNCKIPDIAHLQTMAKPVDRKVIFKESTLILTNKIPPIKMLNIFQKCNVVIEICGYKEVTSLAKLTSEKTSPKKAKKKKAKGKSGTKSKSSGKTQANADTLLPPQEPIILGMGNVDLSSLLNVHWLFKEKVQIYNIKKFLLPLPPLEQHFRDRFTVNEVNLVIDPVRSNKSPLTTQMYLAANTSVKFETMFMAPQYPQFYIENIKKTFKRVLLVVFNEEFAKLIINEILKHNKQVIGDLMLISYANRRRKRAPCDNVLSGYLIDDGANFIFFIEGTSNGHILAIIHKINAINFEIAKVFYNSNLVFDERIFKNYAMWNGFVMSATKMPLRMILSKPLLYVEGNVPVPAWRAIQKLNLLIHTFSFNRALRDNLILSELEFISFSLEFCLQLKYRDRTKMPKLLPEKSYLLSTTDLFTK